MFIQQKSFLREINRVRVSEGRNLEKGLRLDRNEKVDVWPKDFLSRVFSSKPDCFLSVYPESGALYRKLGAHLGLAEDRIVLTAGIDGALKSLFEIMTAPGDTVAVLSPTYAMYKVYSALFQVRLAEIGYRPDLTLDRDRLSAVIDQKPSVLFIPNPNQPIESCFSLGELDDLARQTRDKNCLLVVDEAYFMFGSESSLPLLQKHENVVVLRTFSKGFGVPSVRLGFMASTEDNLRVLAKTRFAHESNALSNAVGEYLLDHYGVVEEYLAKVVAGRTAVKNELARLGYAAHGNVGNYLLIDLGTPANAVRVVEFLKERLIYVKGPWSSPWDKYITITLGPSALMERFLDAMREVGRGPRG